MPKTDIRKIESENVKELTDEALGRTTGNAQACLCAFPTPINCGPPSPSE